MSEFNEDESMEDADRMEDADYQILEDIEDISVKELDLSLIHISEPTRPY